jgi:hypothetical protein
MRKPAFPYFLLLLAAICIGAAAAAGAQQTLPPLPNVMPIITANAQDAAVEAHNRCLQLQAQGCGPGKPVENPIPTGQRQDYAAALACTAAFGQPSPCKPDSGMVVEYAQTADAVVRATVVGVPESTTPAIFTLAITDVYHLHLGIRFAPSDVARVLVGGSIHLEPSGECFEALGPGLNLVQGGDYVVLLGTRGLQDPNGETYGPWDWLRVSSDGSLFSLDVRHTGESGIKDLSSFLSALQAGGRQ